MPLKCVNTIALQHYASTYKLLKNTSGKGAIGLFLMEGFPQAASICRKNMCQMIQHVFLMQSWLLYYYDTDQAWGSLSFSKNHLLADNSWTHNTVWGGQTNSCYQYNLIAVQQQWGIFDSPVQMFWGNRDNQPTLSM